MCVGYDWYYSFPSSPAYCCKEGSKWAVTCYWSVHKNCVEISLYTTVGVISAKMGMAHCGGNPEKPECSVFCFVFKDLMGYHTCSCVQSLPHTMLVFMCSKLYCKGAFDWAHPDYEDLCIHDADEMR